MDGTFIPLKENQRNQLDLRILNTEIGRHGIDLMYVTGRDLNLVRSAIDSFGLPSPTWLICDVGASIYRLVGGDYQLEDSYLRQLARIVGHCDRETMVQAFLDDPELRLQEPAKQTRFKISYYCAAKSLETVVSCMASRLIESNAPYGVVASVDPFSGTGLIDLLPLGVSKAYALDWWANQMQIEPRSILFAGDSGNDLAALTAGYRSIVVGNADESLAQSVSLAHQQAGWSGRLFVARSPATSGVLEGLLHFLQSENRDGCQ